MISRLLAARMGKSRQVLGSSGKYGVRRNLDFKVGGRWARQFKASLGKSMQVCGNGKF